MTGEDITEDDDTAAAEPFTGAEEDKIKAMKGQFREDKSDEARTVVTQW